MDRDAESPVERLHRAEAEAKAELDEAMEWAEEKQDAANQRAEVKLEEANERAETKLEEAYERADEKLAYIDGRRPPGSAAEAQSASEPTIEKKGANRLPLVLAGMGVALLLALLALAAILS